MSGLENKFIENQKGMTLFEVMMAITLWAIFYIAFISSQNYNLLDSELIREEMILKNLAETKINELIVDPPQQYTPALALSKETRAFENEYSNYEYSIEWKQIEIPNMNELLGQDEDENGENQDPAQQQPGGAAIQQIVTQKLKENLEQLIWQVEVTVRNKETDFSYSLSAWVRNYNAQINFAL